MQGRSAPPPAKPSYPETGVGSIAGFGRRFLAFLVDGLIADVISIFVLGGWKAGGEQNAVVYAGFLLIELLFVWLAGQTPGMRLVGIAVVRYGRSGRQTLGWIAARTLLIATIVPAVIPDSEGRYLHDRAAGTVMLRTR